MEVGIEDCLHIEFEYNKSKYVHGQLTLIKHFWCILPAVTGQGGWAAGRGHDFVTGLTRMGLHFQES